MKSSSRLLITASSKLFVLTTLFLFPFLLFNSFLGSNAFAAAADAEAALPHHELQLESCHRFFMEKYTFLQQYKSRKEHSEPGEALRFKMSWVELLENLNTCIQTYYTAKDAGENSKNMDAQMEEISIGLTRLIIAYNHGREAFDDLSRRKDALNNMRIDLYLYNNNIQNIEAIFRILKFFDHLVTEVITKFFASSFPNRQELQDSLNLNSLKFLSLQNTSNAKP
ncbi:MAG: hypothetical protein HQK53_06190 [Oligoflexia bacterium]|nr:hypothetical protein [Oligoflexia bacterium]